MFMKVKIQINFSSVTLMLGDFGVYEQNYEIDSYKSAGLRQLD